MSGNGTPKKKIATNAAAAMPTITRFLSARLPMRSTASSTMASTAAFRPKNSAWTMPDLAERGIDQAQRHDGDEARQHEQRAGDEAALVRCSSQPM